MADTPNYQNVLNEYHPSVATPGIRVTPTPGRQALLKITYEFQNNYLSHG